MTPSDFKAWFEGFTEGLSGVPTKAQWARVKERVGEIDGQAVTERISLDRYWPPYQRWTYPTYTPTCTTVSTFDATTAMYAVGRNDALTLS